ncbi:MAG: hypothetical protein UH853_05715, partial [Muribaculaceae bacterium]|nr:hypothetical protein [Muribaculaceae bacterium]
MIVVACGESRHISDTHKQAEAVMQEYPDSALALLQAINPDDLTTDRGRAMHALLLSQAYDKNYIDLTDDSLITIAVDYFAPTNEHHYAMLAHYYHGRVLQNANRLAESSVALINAENHALKINDDFYLGMIYAVMSSIDNYSYNFEEELKHALKSFEHYSKTTFDLHTAYAQLYLGRAYNNCHQFDKSSAIYKSVIENPIINQDTSTLCQAIQEYAHVKFVEKEYGTSKHMMLSVLNKYKQPIDAVEYGQLGYIYACENKLDSSLYYLSIGEKIMISQQDSASIARGKYNYYITQNDYKNALKYEQEQIAIQNNSTKTVWQQAVVKSQRDYMLLKAETLEQEKQEQNMRYILIVCLLIFVLISVSMFYRHKRHINNLRVNKLEQILTQQRNYTQEQIDKNQEEIAELSQKLKETRSENYILQNKLECKMKELEWTNMQICQNLRQKQTAQNLIKTTEIYMALREKLIAETSVIGPEQWDEISSTIDFYYPGFRVTLLSLCKISQTEMR